MPGRPTDAFFMTIRRFPEGRVGRSAAVSHGGLVYAVAVDPGESDSIAAQTRGALAEIDRVLALAGSDRTQLLQATVYLDDVSGKTEMNDVWCDWIGGEENWPQRACVGATLAPGHMIEIVVTAAKRE